MRQKLFAAGLGLALLLSVSPALAQDSDRWLEDYIKRPEPQSGWKLKSHEKEEGFEVVCLEVVSQVWRGIKWKHRVWVYRSTKTAHPDLSLLLITGGRARGERRLGKDLVKASGGTIAILDSIPNQPLFGGLREDDLIAHTFLEFYKSGKKEWPLLLPMTKGAVKAMDAIEAFSAKTWKTPIKRFVVSGGSKRGWTTWLTGIVDQRVKGIVPIVYDNLNLDEQMKHQLRTWGKYSRQIDEYTKRGLQSLSRTARGRQLSRMVDPWTYCERVKTLPKLLINATNDAYWTLDALNIYWDDLGPGHKSLLYVPNQPHGIRDIERVVGTAGAFVRRIAAGKAMPELDWEHSVTPERTSIKVKPGEVPLEVRVWTAVSESRDFRRSRWTMTQLDASKDGLFRTFYETPETGFKAFFVEVQYGPKERPFSLSTQIRILGKPLRKKARLY